MFFDCRKYRLLWICILAFKWIFPSYFSGMQSSSPFWMKTLATTQEITGTFTSRQWTTFLCGCGPIYAIHFTLNWLAYRWHLSERLFNRYPRLFNNCEAFLLCPLFSECHIQMIALPLQPYTPSLNRWHILFHFQTSR